MMLRRVLPWAAHGLCLVAALAVGRTLVTRGSEAPVVRVNTGSTLEVNGVDWKRNPHTLLLVVQSGCAFCTASAPFYRQLIGAVEGSGVHLVAVSSEKVKVTREYLRSIQVPVADVQRADLGGLGVVGTPTLMLVDSSGRVENVWVGLLKPEGQAEVLGLVDRMRRDGGA